MGPPLVSHALWRMMEVPMVNAQRVSMDMVDARCADLGILSQLSRPPPDGGDMDVYSPRCFVGVRADGRTPFAVTRERVARVE